MKTFQICDFFKWSAYGHIAISFCLQSREAEGEEKGGKGTTIQGNSVQPN